MSEPEAIPTFISAEEAGDTMTLTYRTESGEVGRFAFGRADSMHEFRCLSVAICGIGQSDQEVQLCLKKKGEPSVMVFETRNAEGVVVDKGVEVTHLFRMALEDEQEAWRLARRLSGYKVGAAE